MKRKDDGIWRAWSWAGVVVPVCLRLTSNLTAQEIIIPRSPSQLDLPDAVRQIDAERFESSLNPASPFYVDPNSFLHWGPITARPHLNSSVSYGNSLRSAAGANANTLMESVSPGVLLELGSKWRLDYTPGLTFYESKEFQDTLSHNVSFSGGTYYESWTFGLSQAYSISSQPLIETGRQTEQESFVTSLTSSYHFSSKWMLDFSLSQSIQSAEALTSSKNWSTMEWLNYQIAPRVSVAGGVGGGYQMLNLGSDMANESVQGRLNVRIAQKLNLSLNGGGEVRQVLGSGGDPLINPIYGASIIYNPFQFTTLSLSGNRTVAASLLPGQITEATGISLALSQRLLGKLNLTLSGGFSSTQFILSNSTLALDRSDNTVSFAARLGYGFIKHGTVGIFYNYNKNSSSSDTFGFSSTQVGMDIGYSF